MSLTTERTEPVSILQRERQLRPDLFLLLAYMALGGIGIVMVHTASAPRLELLGAEADCHDLIELSDIKDRDITYVEDCDGRSIFIYRSGDEYTVYDSRCPHQVTNIPHLALSGTRLTCPKHQWASMSRPENVWKKGRAR